MNRLDGSTMGGRVHAPGPYPIRPSPYVPGLLARHGLGVVRLRLATYQGLVL